MTQFGTAYVFGAVPDIQLVLPPGTTRYKIKERPGEFARIFIWTENAITEHYLEIRDGELHPGIVRGSNTTGRK